MKVDGGGRVEGTLKVLVMLGKGEITAPSQLFIRLLLVKRLMCVASLARRVDK